MSLVARRISDQDHHEINSLINPDVQSLFPNVKNLVNRQFFVFVFVLTSGGLFASAVNPYVHISDVGELQNSRKC